MKKLQIILILLVSSLLLSGCSPKHRGGVIMTYIDDLLLTTEKRFFPLSKELSGTIVTFNRAIDGIGRPSDYPTAIVRLKSGDTITVYSTIFIRDFKPGENVKVKSVEYDTSKVVTNNISLPFPKGSENYPMWKCISCKYKNTIGELTLSLNTD